jgi:predicted glycoside hydrolase/deacetylase ChbG (UPF0249 family)
MPARALILNADDFGLWPTVDQAIIDAWSVGAIGDSSVFPTIPNLEEVLQRAYFAGLPVGMHFNLTFGTPLSDPDEVPSLVREDGTFKHHQEWDAALSGDHIRLELRRQAQRILNLGWRPSHLDSHHHVHNHPKVLGVVISLARELRLPVRSVDEGMRRTFRNAHIDTPDEFSIEFYGETATVDTLIRLVEQCEGGVLEIMTHPGYHAPEIPSSYQSDREKELYALTSPRWQKYLITRNLIVGGYHQLDEMKSAPTGVTG